MQFGERLKQLREAAGLSQPMLADRSGISLWSIRNWEQGRRSPDWRALLDLAKALGVQAETFDCCEGTAEKASPRPAGKRSSTGASNGPVGKPRRSRGRQK